MANKFTSPREYKILDGVLYQKCNTCWRRLTKDRFVKSSSAKFWIRTRCYECHGPIQRLRHQKWYENNKEYSKENCRRYHAENRAERNRIKDLHDADFQIEHWFSWSKFHHKTRYYVKIHKLKPKSCPMCWRICNVEIHHPSYENFGKWSSVVFCCHYCHDAIHKWHKECPTPIELLECNSPERSVG